MSDSTASSNLISTDSSVYPYKKGDVISNVGVLDLKCGRFSSFQDIPNEQIRDAIMDAIDEVHPIRWGSTYRRDKAIKFLAAHYLALEQNRNLELGGALSQMDDRGQRPKFNISDDILDLTYYGKEYKRLRDSQLPIIGARIL